MRSLAYFLLYLVSIFGSLAKEGRKLPRQCRPYVTTIKRNNFKKRSELESKYVAEISELKSEYLTKITKLKESNAEKDSEIRGLELDKKRLNEQISLMYDYDENPVETSSSVCPETIAIATPVQETQPTINLESLPDRFTCDTNGKETESQCIQKLQTILQQFISVDQELRLHQHETPYNYKRRLEVLVAGSRERERFYRRLYERSKTDLIMEQDN